MTFEKTVPKVPWSVLCVCMHTVTFCEMIAQKNFVSAPEFSRNRLQSSLGHCYQHLAQKAKYVIWKEYIGMRPVLFH